MTKVDDNQNVRRHNRIEPPTPQIKINQYKSALITKAVKPCKL